jgi:gliding motility-associated-like protein
MVNVEDDLRIPDAFSPNGDNLNDVWVIDRIEAFPNAEVKIYNRWGALLKSISNYSSNPWDGAVSGAPLPVGTYYYIVNKGDGSAAKQNTITITR